MSRNSKRHAIVLTDTLEIRVYEYIDGMYQYFDKKGYAVLATPENFNPDPEIVYTTTEVKEDIMTLREQAEEEIVEFVRPLKVIEEFGEV